MPSISVVVPVYNVERYVSMCLDSLRSQTFADIEVICVDDGSTDRSAMVARAHASLDSRIRVISKPNGGVSSARNVGIRAAAAPVIMFADPDDYLERNACEVVHSVFAEESPDVVTFGAYVVPSSASTEWFDRNLCPRDVVYEGFSSDMLFKENSHPFPWRTAVRRGFLEENELLFDESVKYGEDQVFHFELYPLSGKTVFLSDRLYYYRLSRSDSMMNERSGLSERKNLEHIYVVERIFDAWRRRGFEQLCAPELLTWTLEFVVPGLLSVEKEKRACFCRRFGEVLSAKLWNLEDVASRCSKATQRLVNLLVNGSDADYGLRFTAQSVLYLEGKRAFARVALGKLIAPISCVASKVLPLSSAKQRYLLNRIFDGTIESASAEQALTGSLLLLEFELSNKARD